MSNHTLLYFFFVFNRFYLFKVFLCCFLYKHLYSYSLSNIAMISSLNILELSPACFSCSNNFILSQSSLDQMIKNIVEIPEARIAGDLSNFISVRSLVFLLTGPLIRRSISLAKYYNYFLSAKLARSTE